MKSKILAIIPARAGSKRILNKNTRLFNGRPLIYYSIRQALGSGLFNKVIVDTDSREIAKLAQKYGAKIPFLRPSRLAQDTSRVADSILYLLSRLKKEKGYVPSHVALLQTTSPLREIEDIKKCWQIMKKTKATTVVTVCAPRPKPKDLYWLKNTKIIATDLTAGPQKGVLCGCNGFVFLFEVKAFLAQKKIITKNTYVLVCPEWRSIDIDMPEEWVLAELLYKNKLKINKCIETLIK